MKVIIGRFFYQKKGRERGECTSLCKWEAERDGLGMETDMVGEKESMREDIGIRQIKKIDLTQNYEREVSWWFKKTEREKEKQKGDEKIPRYTPEKERRGNREREHQQVIVNRRRINCSEKLCLRTSKFLSFWVKYRSKLAWFTFSVSDSIRILEDFGIPILVAPSLLLHTQ